MSKVSAKIKEAAGYVEEEAGEMINKEKWKQEGRELRNEGRMEDGKFPKLTPVGTTDTK